MSRYTPHVVLIMEGGVIQNIYCDNADLRIVLIDEDIEGVEEGVNDDSLCEELEAFVTEPFDCTSTPDLLGDEYLETIAKFLEWE